MIVVCFLWNDGEFFIQNLILADLARGIFIEWWGNSVRVSSNWFGPGEWELMDPHSPKHVLFFRRTTLSTTQILYTMILLFLYNEVYLNRNRISHRSFQEWFFESFFGGNNSLPYYPCFKMVDNIFRNFEHALSIWAIQRAVSIDGSYNMYIIIFKKMIP